MSYDFNAQSRDAIILDLVSNGMSLNKATKEYVKLKKAAGFTVGVTSHKTEAMSTLDAHGLTGSVDAKPLVAELTKLFDVTPDTAMGYIKAHAEIVGYTVKSRMASEDILDWIVDNAPATECEDWDQFDEAFKVRMKSQGKSDSNINEYRKGIKLHLMLARR